MSSAPLDRLLRSTSVRLAAIYAGLLLVTFVAAGSVAWVVTRSSAENEIRERIALEVDALQDEFISEGSDGVIEAITFREHNPGALNYRLLDRRGRVLIGNLDIDHVDLGAYVLDIPETQTAGSRDFILLTTRMPDGSLLTVGDNLDRAEKTKDAVLEAIVWVGLAAVIMVLAAGLFTARGVLKRVDVISSTMKRVGAGDLSARAPARASGDDLDRIGGGINEMLEHIDVLVGDVKRVSVNIAHDLRTPLAHLHQKLEKAAGRQNLAEAHADINAATLKVAEILRIFDAMLRLSAIEASSASSRFALVDLAEIVDRVTDAYRPDIEAAGQTLDVKIEATPPVRGDPALIAQAVGNLLDNALRYAGEGAVIVASLANRAGMAVLEIADSGQGIPDKDHERVLRPFERVDASRTQPGAGLGLSIVSAIARLHDARLALENAKPGIRVTITWPRG
ncbi:MAG: HAMP domain-containing protein [Burkholderiales bacterium]|nr:MAG: HAMP domain-containing protein [Burkholderiales bacterium]